MRTSTALVPGILLTLAIAACGGSGAATAPAGEAPASEAPASEAPASEGGAGAACEAVQEAGTVQAQAKDFAFAPEPVTASVGDAITWTNGDSAPHTVTLDDGSCDTGQFGQGETGTLRFTAAGSYPYHCTLHPNMKGTIEVS